ncbi:conserved hypothetical protein [Talaromyces stipitatus ATCC 10500]|uniref:Uncharacterized protein n=1 Tax=Talaromyces stipitatus (strain ATCC 10500 / CBS 375.48 / QM 6759 / NRRL 1006) TaxID=441959 RepID=B8MR61_TALSN|nr:uncharacterized protein TSTA_054660 [Talaromyces stipitatus ATCC 10500]EED12956.1 conserved hypothetical protein [Talaromyces stipitatus ATCC 10500]
MESVPLTLAHTHARNAMLETRKSNPVAASEEHDLAAGEFATASQHCLDAYALRTLKLLEEEHKRLAILLRSQHENPASVSSPDPSIATPSQSRTKESQADVSTPSKTNPISTSISAATNELLQHPPRLPGHHRQLQRDTSSIASNLASARGIPSYPRRAAPASPTLSAQPAGGQLSDSPSRAKTSEGRLRERAGKFPSAPRQPWTSPSISPTEITLRQIVPADAHEPQQNRGHFPTTDETFQKFYSRFEGLISKLSAPLAFAGLPLGTDNSDPAKQKSPADTKIDRQNAVSQRRTESAEPDINSIFSRAALRAVREANGGMPSSGAESFYVVPTTGGTVSYAGILSRAEKETRRGSVDDGDEDFVDARETPPSPEMRQSLSGSRTRLTRAGTEKSTKTMEELRMENEALKQLSDQLSKRLHMWEVNAQSSSMALQQSLKAMHHQQNTSSPTASSAMPHPSDDAVDNHEQRIRELEAIIQRSEKERDKVVRENEKLKSVLGRYRDRWEKLKEGAKTRRNAAESSSAAAGESPVTTPTLQQGEDREPSGLPDEQNRSSGNDEDAA